MPLTTKGRELLRKFKQEYGAKNGEGVLYAAKNRGTVTGIDDTGTEASSVGAESWVHGRKNSTGYQITADQCRRIVRALRGRLRGTRDEHESFTKLLRTRAS